jgi:hypothetical protein
MPRVRASILLPYALKLQHGLYPTSHPGRTLEVTDPNLVPGVRPRTTISITTVRPDTEDLGEQGKLNSEQADVLLGLTNRLLRGYRAVTKDSTINELSRAGASPFRFSVDPEGTKSLTWESELTYPADPPKKLGQGSKAMGRCPCFLQGLRLRLATENERPVIPYRRSVFIPRTGKFLGTAQNQLQQTQRHHSRWRKRHGG